MATAVVVGGFGGIAVGALLAAVLPPILGRLEPRHVRLRRSRLVAQAPLVADLLAACLAAGAPTVVATATVADAIGEPAAGSLRNVVAALRLGADPVLAWSVLGEEPGLRSIAVAVARSSRSGAPLAAVLGHAAADLRREARLHVEVAARAAGVRAVAPLAACFLPAFLLLGVVPLVVSLVGQLVG